MPYPTAYVALARALCRPRLTVTKINARIEVRKGARGLGGGLWAPNDVEKRDFNFACLPYGDGVGGLGGLSPV